MNILQVNHLSVSFRTPDGILQAVRDVSFGLKPGQTLAIVGESGSGKSVTSKAILGILSGNAMVDAGQILYDGRDLLQLDEQALCALRGDDLAMIFQDPLSSLDPIVKIGKQITEAMLLKHRAACRRAKQQVRRLRRQLKTADPAEKAALAQALAEASARANSKLTKKQAKQQALELMAEVGISNPEQRFYQYPFQFSGGMRQRIVIAIALSCQPKILICDEPTTALDVTIQAQILKLIKDLQKEFGYTIVFITHDLGVVANVADRVAVLYAGQVIELGTAEDIFYDPRHPYTWALLSSLPQLAQRNTKLYSITGTPPSLYNKIVGDAFAPRNPYCLKVDTLKEPPQFPVTETHFARTWLLDPRAPKVEKPEIIQDIHEKLLKTYDM